MELGACMRRWLVFLEAGKIPGLFIYRHFLLFRCKRSSVGRESLLYSDKATRADPPRRTTAHSFGGDGMSSIVESRRPAVIWRSRDQSDGVRDPVMVRNNVAADYLLKF